ncbi:uncharacterized protein LOC143955778 [Lithobates pipiens]
MFVTINLLYIQIGNLGADNIVVKEEYKEEDEEYGVMKELPGGHKEVTMESPNTRNPPERCPRPLYSRDSTQEDHTIPHHHQSRNLSVPTDDVKEQIKEEEEDGVMESEFHKDLYQATMVESSSYRNPPERCPRPLYSRDSTQEDHDNYEIPDQSGNPSESNFDVKEEDEEYIVVELSEGHTDLYKNITMEPTNDWNPPEICPHPLYSWDCTQEGLTIPHHHQGEDLINLQIECEVEEEFVWVEQYTEEAGMTRTFIEEDTPTEISTGHAMEKPSKDRLTLSPGCKLEDGEVTGDYVGEKPMISTMDGGLHSVDRPWSPSDSEQPRTVRDGAGIQEKTFPCPECGESFSSGLGLFTHQRSHADEDLYHCFECGENFSCMKEFLKHHKSHRSEKLYFCSDCESGFSVKSSLTRHQRLHTKEGLFICSECGKGFIQRGALTRHQRSHMRKDTCFLQKSEKLLRDLRRTHTTAKMHH